MLDILFFFYAKNNERNHSHFHYMRIMKTKVVSGGFILFKFHFIWDRWFLELGFECDRGSKVGVG